MLVADVKENLLFWLKKLREKEYKEIIHKVSKE